MELRSGTRKGETKLAQYHRKRRLLEIDVAIHSAEDSPDTGGGGGMIGGSVGYTKGDFASPGEGPRTPLDDITDVDDLD